MIVKYFSVVAGVVGVDAKFERIGSVVAKRRGLGRSICSR